MSYLIQNNFLLVLLVIWFFINGNDTLNANSTDLKTHGRVIGGYSCTTEQHPYLVLILRKSEDGELHRVCGGTLLDSRLVLTAAHCLKFDKFEILAGINNPQGKPTPRNVVRAYPHPKFNLATTKNDIGVLLLDKPIEKSAHIQYAKLPERPYENKELEKDCSSVLVMGWGLALLNKTIEFPGFSNPQCALLSAISHKDCKKKHSDRVYVHDESMCTLSEGKYPCVVDSGGPVMCKTLQVGIISWSLDCNGIDPEVYTRVDKYLDYIHWFMTGNNGQILYNNFYKEIYFWFYLIVINYIIS